MAINMVKLPTQKQDLVLRVAKGHFATKPTAISIITLTLPCKRPAFPKRAPWH